MSDSMIMFISPPFFPWGYLIAVLQNTKCVDGVSLISDILLKQTCLFPQFREPSNFRSFQIFSWPFPKILKSRKRVIECYIIRIN